MEKNKLSIIGTIFDTKIETLKQLRVYIGATYILDKIESEDVHLVVYTDIGEFTEMKMNKQTQKLEFVQTHCIDLNRSVSNTDKCLIYQYEDTICKKHKSFIERVVDLIKINIWRV